MVVLNHLGSLWTSPHLFPRHAGRNNVVAKISLADNGVTKAFQQGKVSRTFKLSIQIAVGCLHGSGGGPDLWTFVDEIVWRF